MNRRRIFDVVRELLGRGFHQAEVARIDRAIDLALAQSAPRRLGALSERFESGDRGPGAVSNGRGDPGGVSYGIWQFASRTGTVATFLAAEGARWRREFGGAVPGAPDFSTAWKAIAAREPEAFAEAQHAFIERTHYRPAVAGVKARTGLDLESRHAAVRDVAWSVAVQHGGATSILAAAVVAADRLHGRDDAAYDRALIAAVYDERSGYVLRVAGRSGPNSAQGRTLRGIAQSRYPAELKAALVMLGDPVAV